MHEDVLKSYLQHHDLFKEDNLNGASFRIGDLGFGIASVSGTMLLSIAASGSIGAPKILLWNHVTPDEALMIIELCRIDEGNWP